MKRSYLTRDEYFDLCAVQRWENEGGGIPRPPQADASDGQDARPTLRGRGLRRAAVTGDRKLGRLWKAADAIHRSRRARHLS